MIRTGEAEGSGWAPADVQLAAGSWVLGWARQDQYQAGARYVRVHYIGAAPGAVAARARVVFR